MPRKPEPKFVVKYVKSTLSEEEKQANYVRLIKHLVVVVKEQEALELKNNKKQNKT